MGIILNTYDIDGFVTGFGNPDWAKTHEAASRTSHVVSALVEGGATCIGKTVVDEMAFSICGENKHYDPPTNPAAPTRIPGGCSSGSAVAVAANLVDFSLGDLALSAFELLRAYDYGHLTLVTGVSFENLHNRKMETIWLMADPSMWRLSQADMLTICWIQISLKFTGSTGFSNTQFILVLAGIDSVGGVRVPAAYCGILGFRPSHGAVSHMGIIPVSTSLDCVGWFAKDPNVLRRVGHVLLQLPFAVQRNPRNIIIADDCFQQSKIAVDRVSQVVIKSTEKLFGRQVLKHDNLGDYFDSKIPSLKTFYSQKSNGEVKYSSMRLLANVMQLLQRHEFNRNHDGWINSVKPNLGPVVSAQVHERLEVPDREIENFHLLRNEMRAALNTLLKDDGILVVPTIADPPPKLGAKEISSEDHLARAFTLLSLASMSGCCQVTVPLGFHDKYPVSVSFIARHGGDRFLLDTLQSMYTCLEEHADLAAKSKLSTNVVGLETSAEIAKEKVCIFIFFQLSNVQDYLNP
ncbi:unnamed protein product [Ilex paraguariensis]|uniref:Amidase domain-containing protein n=1 Tax=Ilex paraguariensis TaxID=185542 RepID=A0ABC8SCR6_9AQUA